MPPLFSGLFRKSVLEMINQMIQAVEPGLIRVHPPKQGGSLTGEETQELLRFPLVLKLKVILPHIHWG